MQVFGIPLDTWLSLYGPLGLGWVAFLVLAVFTLRLWMRFVTFVVESNTKLIAVLEANTEAKFAQKAAVDLVLAQVRRDAA